MTGEFDADARAQDIAAIQARAQGLEKSSDEGSQEGSPEPDNNNQNNSSFFTKLVALNDKIDVFKNQFYGKKPKQQISYDRILKDKKLNFSTFK